MTERELLSRTAEIAADYLESLDTRPVRPERDYRGMHRALDGPVPEGPTDATEVVEELAASLDPGITAMGSGRFFGFVADKTGGWRLPGPFEARRLLARGDAVPDCAGEVGPRVLQVAA